MYFAEKRRNRAPDELKEQAAGSGMTSVGWSLVGTRHYRDGERATKDERKSTETGI